MTNKELAQYLLQSLNMGLGALMQGETSYTNSFDVKIMSDGFSLFHVFQQATSLMTTSIRKSS